MSDVASLLPPNATPLERAVEQSTARLGAIDLSAVAQLWNPQTCPVALLPWLAWTVGVDSWNSAWPEATKRAVIAAAPLVRRQRGTAGAVKAAVAAFGSDLTVVEWWQMTPPGQPGTFSILVAPGAVVSTDDVVAAVAAAKNTRSHFTVGGGSSLGAQIGVYVLVQPTAYARLCLVAQ